MCAEHANVLPRRGFGRLQSFMSPCSHTVLLATEMCKKCKVSNLCISLLRPGGARREELLVGCLGNVLKRLYEDVCPCHSQKSATFTRLISLDSRRNQETLESTPDEKSQFCPRREENLRLNNG